MSLDQRFFRYLDHLGQTETVRALHENPEASDVVALRHDVDHDLDLALEMAFWEHQRGCRATYFLLHTAEYWHDEQLVAKCRQLEDFGHEVGLHLNVVAEWARGEIDDVDAHLAGLLARLRDGGVDVAGVSAHGDRLCYENGFINYWIFAELRPGDPDAAESGRSAEGVPVDDARFQVTYPANGVVDRDGGARLALWSSSLTAHGLGYHAYHVASDRYLTDSGGAWTRSADPLELDVARGRHQVLMHPVYYRGPQRFFLFLSTARSGSKWLTEVLDAGAAVTARHEFTFNHRFDGDEPVADKRTGAGFRSLVHQPVELRRLVADARTWVEEQVVGDWAEANVYLVHALPQVAHYLGDATLVHLHRHPHDVVRSLLERGWYETPEDDHHPVVDVEGWNSLTQLEKACHYVRRVNEDLLSLDLPRFPLEGLTADPAALQRRLAELGIASFPRLVAPVHARVVNASTSSVTSPDDWSGDARRTLERICGPVAAALGYRRGVSRRSRVAARLFGPRPARQPSNHGSRAATPLLSSADLAEGGVPLGVAGGAIDSRDSEHLAVAPDGQRHTWVFLGVDGWGHLDGAAGLPASPGTFVSGRVRLDVEGAAPVSAAVFALLFDVAGRPRGRRRLCALSPSEVAGFSFKPPANCERFAVAVYVPLTPRLERLRIGQVQVDRLPLPIAEGG